MMKHTLYILLATVLFTACQKDPMENITTASGKLTFNTSIDGMPIAQSRAAGVDTDLIASGFYLAGYHTEGLMDATAATAFPNVFDKEATDNQIAVPLVKYQGGKFTLKTIKWTLDDVSFLSFFGWSQNKAFATSVNASTTGIIGQTYDIRDKGYPWLDIRNADAPLDQTDVVGSRSIDHKNDAVLSAVDLDFRHLLSKLTFKAKSSSKVTITFTEVSIKYAANKVRKKARYIFGSDPLSIGSFTLDATEHQAGTHALNATPPTITAGAMTLLGSALLLPQVVEAGDVSIELKYKISPNGTTQGPEQTKTLPLSASTFGQGNNYVYTIDIQATDISISGYPTIEPWNIIEASLPLVSGPKGDVLLLLDGYDRPYQHTDGKWYWLDRSGWNRHVELVGYYATQHDRVNHCYTFKNTAGNYGLIPAFPEVTALSADVVCQNTKDNDQVLFSFINHGNSHASVSSRKFFAQFGYGNDYKLYFDTQGTAQSGRLLYQSTSAEIKLKLMWSFQKQDKGNILIYANGLPKAKMTDTGSGVLGVLSDNRIGSSFEGTISYVKVMRGLTSLGEMTADYNAQSLRHGLDAIPSPDGFIPNSILLKAGWPADRLLAEGGLQVAMRGNQVKPGGTAAEADAPRMQWKTEATATAGVESTRWENAKLGLGKINTDMMIEAGADLHPAAKYCREMGADWYLPSVAELRLIYKNRQLLGPSYTFQTDNEYWGSTEVSSSSSQGCSFNDNTYMYEDLKTSSNYVRCVKGAPDSGIIPSEVLTAGGWPTNKLPKTGLQVAMRGNLLPGNAANTDDPIMPITKEYQHGLTGFGPSSNLGDGKTNYALFAVDLDMYVIGNACKNLGPEWYVPSKDELILIYNNRFLLGASYSFLPEQYWSASEATNIRFFTQNFASNGVISGEYEMDPRRVRCVRNID